MKDRLDKLTLQDLIELSCGDFTVLSEGKDEPKEELLLCASRIMTEYKSIASPVQAKMDLSENTSLSKLKIKESCARICMLLCGRGHPEMAREVLVNLGIGLEALDTTEKVMAHCQSILGEVEFETKRIKERREKAYEKAVKTDVRKQWYSEIAYVMSVFKMSIDPGTINAAIYANLMSQAVERSKALAKMPQLGGLI